MHFIITCGTSQTGIVERGTPINYDLSEIGYEELRTHFFREDFSPNEDEARNTIQHIAGAVADRVKLNNFSEFIGTEQNPAGAEISTLYMVSAEEQDGFTDNQFHILHSDTYEGWLNAMILEETLSRLGWGDSKLHKVDNLREQPKPEPDPLNKLSIKMVELLKGPLHAVNQPPVIISTGGFKSVIPCLTVYALVFALPMVYLFEKSRKLQYVHPVFQVNARNDHKKSWKKIWKKIDDLKTIQNMEWFSMAITARIDPDVNYGWL